MPSICCTDIFETLRDENLVAECAQSIRKECKNYCFNLDDFNCNPRDVAHSLNQYKNDKLPIWEMFFKNLFPKRNRYENIRKYDTIFPVIYNMGYDSTKNFIS